MEAAKNDPRSILALYHRLLALRRAGPALRAGPYAAEAGGDVLAFTRGEFLVALSLGPRPHLIHTPRGATVLLSTHLAREGESTTGSVHLRGDEGLILRLARE